MYESRDSKTAAEAAVVRGLFLILMRPRVASVVRMQYKRTYLSADPFILVRVTGL